MSVTDRPEPHATRTRRQRVEFFVALGALAAMGPLSMDMFFPALPAAARDLEVEPSGIMLTVTAYLLGVTIGQAVGPLSDVIGRRRPLLVGVSLFALASVVCATAQSIEILTGARFVQGIATAVGVVVSRAIIRDLYTGANVARHYSTLISIVGLSAIVSPTIGTSILEAESWRSIFVFLVGFAIVLFGLVWLRLPESLPVERRRSGNLRATGGTYAGLLRDRRFLGYMITLSAGTGTLTALVTGSTFVVQDGFDASTQTFAFMFSAGALAVVLVTLVNRRLLRRFSPRRLLVVGLTVNLAGALALLFVGRLNLLPYAVCFVVVIASWGFISANATAAAVRDYAPVAGAALALLGLAAYTTAALTAPLAGAAGSGSATAVAVVVVVLSLTALTSATLTVSRERKQGRELARAVARADAP